MCQLESELPFEKNDMQQKKYFLLVPALTILIAAGCANKAADEMMMTNKKKACGAWLKAKLEKTVYEVIKKHLKNMNVSAIE